MLKEELQTFELPVEQAVEDADVLIINTAMRMCSTYDSVIIVGEDIDLLVILTGLAQECKNIFFSKPGKGRTAPKMYSPHCLKYNKDVADNILFLHAFTGCDTTSAMYNVGKTKFMKKLNKNDELVKAAKLFKNKNLEQNVISEAGEQLFIALYGGSNTEASIDSLRFKCFLKSSNKTKLNLSGLPPTKAAARQHSYRTYHQVQAWLGEYLDPEEWGWKRSVSGLHPIRTTLTAAPETLLKLISCKCKTKCGAACGCRKAGLKCTIICCNCSGQTCDNRRELLDTLDEDEIDDDLSDNVDDELPSYLQENFNQIAETQPGPSKIARLI